MSRTEKWTCGECGDSYEASGFGADFAVGQWMRDHKEKHRVEKLPKEEQAKYHEQRAQAILESMRFRAEAADVAKGSK